MGMDYPEQLSIAVLQSVNAEYAQLKPYLTEIDVLSSGGHRLRRHVKDFLPRRHGEEYAVYEARVKKFTYSNVFGSAVSQLSAKFGNGQIDLKGVSDDDFWASFRRDNNGQGRSEIQLAVRLFSEVMRYKTAFVHVDMPAVEEEPRSQAEEIALGLMPRAVVYPALQVCGWSETDGSLDWVKVIQFSEYSPTPLSPPLTRATWTIIDDECIARYSALVNIKDGVIVEILDEDGEAIEVVNEETKIDLSAVVEHGFGVVPVIKVEVGSERWGGDQAAAKAREALLLECHRFDYLTAVYPQRTYKPFQKPDDALDATFVDDDGPMPTGLEYVLKLDEFRWNEPAGAILEPLSQVLSEATADIRAILAVGGAYVQQATEASGVSKELDFAVEDERLKSFGRIICDALADIYKLVAIAHNESPDEISVNGLDDFSRERLSKLLASLMQISEIDMAALQSSITPTLFGIVQQKLMTFLAANLSPEEKAQIESEIDAITGANRSA